MHITSRAWYCARTKPKHEHIAASNMRKYLGLEVFHPKIRVERATLRGPVRTVESVFPCYVFVRCVIQDFLNEIRYTNGVSSIVHFADKIPTVSDTVIADLQSCFDNDEPMIVQEKLSPGAGVLVSEGAFAGMRASVLQVMAAGQRVQVLLEILGRPTAVEVSRCSVSLEKHSLADSLPLLAVSRPSLIQV